MKLQIDPEWLSKMADKEADVDFTIGNVEDAIGKMRMQNNWWYDRANIPNQSGFRLILRLKGNETKLDKVVLCPDGCYRLATTDIDKIEGWLPVELPSINLGQSGLKFHPGS